MYTRCHPVGFIWNCDVPGVTPRLTTGASCRSVENHWFNGFTNDSTNDHCRPESLSFWGRSAEVTEPSEINVLMLLNLCSVWQHPCQSLRYHHKSLPPSSMPLPSQLMFFIKRSPDIHSYVSVQKLRCEGEHLSTLYFVEAEAEESSQVWASLLYPGSSRAARIHIFGLYLNIQTNESTKILFVLGDPLLRYTIASCLLAIPQSQPHPWPSRKMFSAWWFQRLSHEGSHVYSISNLRLKSQCSVVACPLTPIQTELIGQSRKELQLWICLSRILSSETETEVPCIRGGDIVFHMDVCPFSLDGGSLWI